MATVNFTIDSVKASKTLATAALTKEYDSSVDEQPGAIGGAGGTSEGNLTPVEQIADRLIEQCAQQFVWKISPHSVTFQVQMAKGKTKLVAAGNELARSGKYAEALDCYLRAMELRPDDDGAVFNAGLMFEALQQFQKADDCYTKAFAIKDRDTYLLARKRVRQGSDYQ
jgi:tetratricopeptide (TPR) repeat protein